MKGIRAEVKGKPGLIACDHWKTFPPMASALGQDAETLRRRGMLSETEYQRVQVWERVCGLGAMDADKCMGCPHVRQVTRDHTGVFLTTMDGSKRSRITDPIGAGTFRKALETVARPPGSIGSKENAAWVVKRNG